MVQAAREERAGKAEWEGNSDHACLVERSDGIFLRCGISRTIYSCALVPVGGDFQNFRLLAAGCVRNTWSGSLPHFG